MIFKRGPDLTVVVATPDTVLRRKGATCSSSDKKVRQEDTTSKMSDRIEIGNVCKFDENNYPQWKFQIKCALCAKEIYGLTDGTVTRSSATQIQNLKVWQKKDALAMFTFAMDLKLITFVENCETFREMLSKIRFDLSTDI